MNLKPIEEYEGLYSFDLNNNMIYSHYSNKYLKPTIENDGYIRITFYKNDKLKHFQYHRLVYEYNIGKIPTGLIIDHIDGNKQNNNIDNLRLCSQSQNCMNCKTKKNNLSSGYKNITLTKCNTYLVRIWKNNIVKYCKTFKTLEDAIINRDIQMKLIHGEFCNLG